MSLSTTNRLAIAIMALVAPVTAAELRFVPLNDEIAGREIAVRDSKGTTGLMELSSRKRSEPYNCVAGEKPLELVALDRDGAAAAIDLPESIKAPLVLILPDSDNPTGLRALAVEDSDSGFPWGTLMFVNLSDGPLVVRCDKEEVTIPVGDKPVLVMPGGAGRNVGLQIFKKDQPDAVLYSAVWEHDPKLRKLIFAVTASDDAAKASQLKIVPQDQRAEP